MSTGADPKAGPSCDEVEDGGEFLAATEYSDVIVAVAAMPVWQ